MTYLRVHGPLIEVPTDDGDVRGAGRTLAGQVVRFTAPAEYALASAAEPAVDVPPSRILRMRDAS